LKEGMVDDDEELGLQGQRKEAWLLCSNEY
jgi:hypothetical protein